MMQIGEVASRTDLSIRTIRHWEDVGLVRPTARSTGGFRLYSDEDVARIRLLRFMKPLRFTLDQMRELLALRESVTAESADRLSGLVWPESADAPDDTTIGRVAAELEHFAQLAELRLARLHDEVEQVEHFIHQLRKEASRRPSERPGT